jgi:hypothetical protein
MADMVTRPAPFRQADVKRAVRGAQDAGMTVARVEIERDGRIVVIAATINDQPADDLDKWRATRAR